MRNDFEEVKNNLEKSAYAWAIQEKDRMGCEVEPICLNLDTDCLTTDASNFVVSILILT